MHKYGAQQVCHNHQVALVKLVNLMICKNGKYKMDMQVFILGRIAFLALLDRINRMRMA